MRLTEYLEALKNYPDEQLTDELGICDNWTIFLNTDFNTYMEHLRQSENYMFDKEILKTDGVGYLFSYIPRAAKLQAFNDILPFSTTGFGNNHTEQEKIESERQLRDYTITVILNAYPGKKVEEIQDLRALAMMAEDIGKFAIREKVPICMPKSIGNKHVNGKDLSRIVYYRPGEE